MSWAEVFKINSNMHMSLDKQAYQLFYNLAVVANKGCGSKSSDVMIIPYGTESITDGYASNGTMKVVVCPDTMKKIYDMPFENCSNLQSIFIPEGFETMGVLSFKGCNNLKSIRLPSTTQLVNVNAFGESGITDIYVPWSEGAISGAPWGASNATVHYNS